MEDVFCADPAGGFQMLPFPEIKKADGTPFVDAVARTIKELGCWEPDETEIFVEILSDKDAAGRGELFVDAGSHIGYYSLIAAKLGYDVHAFEFDRDVFNRLCENVALNKLESKIHATHGYLCDVAGGVAKGVNRISLDSFSFSKPIRLLKIDAEGFDPVIVRGASKLFQDRKISYACVEISPKFEHKTPFSEYIKMTLTVAQHGYKVYNIGISPKRKIRFDTDHLKKLDRLEISPVNKENIVASVGAEQQTNFLFIKS